MENKTIARTLRLLSQLMELHDENPFKVKSVAYAAFKVDELPFPIATKSLDEMEKLDGLGKSTASNKTVSLGSFEFMIKSMPKTEIYWGQAADGDRRRRHPRSPARCRD